MQRINDPRFLRKFCRLVSWPSRYLDGGVIVIDDSGPRLEVHITNGLCSLVGISWSSQRATLLPGSSLLSARHLSELDETLTIHVCRLLRKHRLIDNHGRSTRRRTA